MCSLEWMIFENSFRPFRLRRESCPAGILNGLTRAQTNHGNSLAKAAERSELRKTLLGDDFDDLPAPATRPLSTSQSIAQIIGKAVDGVFDKVQHISTSAKAREQRINQILNETKGQLLAKGYDAAESWDGWPKLAQTCDSTIVALLMEA